MLSRHPRRHTELSNSGDKSKRRPPRPQVHALMMAGTTKRPMAEPASTGWPSILTTRIFMTCLPRVCPFLVARRNGSYARAAANATSATRVPKGFAEP